MEAPKEIYVQISHPYSEEYTEIIGFEEKSSEQDIKYIRADLAELTWEQMDDEHGKELLYVCQKTAEREHCSGVREGKAQAISNIRNQVKLWMPDNPEGDEYEAGKRLAFASVLQYLKELEAQQDDICSGCTNVKGCVTCVDGNMKEFAEDKDLEKAAEEYAYTNWESDDYHDGASEGLPFDPIGHTEKCFKAGAEWMAGQGKSIVAKIGIATEEVCCTIPEEILDSLGVRTDDEIIIQVRKK